MLEALQTAGNPGRGAHEPTLHAARLVYDARAALAELFGAENPACIAFASNATQALNTAIGGLIGPADHVITTVCEHNSVLRPLYRLREQGTQLSFVGVDDRAVLRYEQFEELLRPNTKAVVVTGASNVTGNATDLAVVAHFAKKHGLLLIVDAAQTAGACPIPVQKLGIDVLCFTGHKGLLGPQGTGGLYVRPGLRAAPLVVGGSGVHSFDERHPAEMPTALEAGTLNVPGIAGLGAGVRWILEQGVETLQTKETALARLFYEAVRKIPGVVVYGSFEEPRAPIVSLNLAGEDSARVADALWEEFGICVRAGAHCAPLMHRALGTERQGVVRAVQLFAPKHRGRGPCGGTGSACLGAGGVRCEQNDRISFFRSGPPWMRWRGKNAASRNRSPAGSFRCRGSCPPGAALRGGCCRRTGSAGGNDLIPPNTPPPRR